MVTNSSSTNLVIGLAAVGVGLVAAGVGLYRRRRAESASGGPQDDLQAEAGARNEEQSPAGEIVDDRESLGNTPSHNSQKNPLLEYFGLVFALTVPFWLFGNKPLPIPVKLPVSAMAWVNPLIAAVILTYRREGSTGVKELFKRVLDFRKTKNKAWYLPVLFLSPLIAFLAYAVMRMSGLPLPDPQIPWLMVPAFFLAFFIGGIGEELGWMGYAFDPMQDRWGALKASVILGLVWGIFHVIPDIQNGQTADWILWQRLGTIGLRILMAWVYNNTGRSVFAAILFHVTNNMSWALFPNYGSHYDPFVFGLIIFLAAGIVITGWDSKTMTRYRFARLSGSASKDERAG